MREFYEKFVREDVFRRGPTYDELLILRDEVEDTIDVHSQHFRISYDPVEDRHVTNTFDRSHVRTLISILRKLGFDKNRRRAIRQLDRCLKGERLVLGVTPHVQLLDTPHPKQSS